MTSCRNLLVTEDLRNTRKYYLIRLQGMILIQFHDFKYSYSTNTEYVYVTCLWNKKGNVHSGCKTHLIYSSCMFSYLTFR